MQRYFTKSLYANDKTMFADMMKYIRQLEQAIIDSEKAVNLIEGVSLCDWVDGESKSIIKELNH